MMQIPVLQSQRLILRSPTESDWPDYAALMMSGRAVYMGGPHSRAAAWGMFCHDIAQWHLMDHGALMIEDRNTGLCLGQVGINHGPLFPERELGWYVYQQAEGKGFAFEAAQTLLTWAFEVRQFSTLVSYVDPNNERSQTLALKLGASLDADAPRPDQNDLVFRHTNDQA